MTTEDDFHAALDANPEDHHTRLVFADWLDERGDERGPGYRAMGLLARYPMTRSSIAGTYFAFHAGQGRIITDHRTGESQACLECHSLPVDWIILSGAGYGWIESGIGDIGRTRRAVEDVAALAFAKLSAARRAELLATTGPQ